MIKASHGVQESAFGRAAFASANAAFEFGYRAHETFRRWRLERQTVNALSGLDNHILKDIGLSRSDIHWLARRVSRDPGYVHGPRNA